MASADRRCFGLNRNGTQVWKPLPPADSAGVTPDPVAGLLVDTSEVQHVVCLAEVTVLSAMVESPVSATARASMPSAAEQREIG